LKIDINSISRLQGELCPEFCQEVFLVPLSTSESSRSMAFILFLVFLDTSRYLIALPEPSKSDLCPENVALYLENEEI
jgi:hypothetical protein